MIAVVLGARDWRELAACLRADPELFFPVADEGADAGTRQAREAVSFCTGCPVRPECLDFALRNGITHGIFGGLTETERRASSLPSLCASGRHLAVPGPRGACPACQAEARARRSRAREAARVRDQSGRKGPLRGHRKGVKGIAA